MPNRVVSWIFQNESGCSTRKAGARNGNLCLSGPSLSALLEVTVRREEVGAGHVRQRIPGGCGHFRLQIYRLHAVVVPEDILAGRYRGQCRSSCRRPVGGVDGAPAILLFSTAYWSTAAAIKRRSLMTRLAWVRFRARRNPGTAIAASNAMIATTIMISTRVKPPCFLFELFIIELASRWDRGSIASGLSNARIGQLC